MRIRTNRFRLPVALIAAAAVAVSASAALSAPAGEKMPKVKTGKPIRLFNGKNLDNFYTYLTKSGKNNDPAQVFTVRDGMIRVSGTEFGHFITENEYDNYHLIVEFKWGDETHAPRKAAARDSGILFHYVGPDKVWGKSLEFQIIEGGTGDLILVDGASVQVNGKTVDSGRIDRMNKGPWQDLLGYRDPVAEVEKPHGQWNRLDLIARGDSADYYVNGRKVNSFSGGQPTRGKILFQSEGAEIFFSRIELRPLRK